MSKRYRQLLPVPQSESSSSSQPSGSSTTPRSSSDEPLKRQRISTQLACNSCRKRKIRVSHFTFPHINLPPLTQIVWIVRWEKACVRGLSSARRKGTMHLCRDQEPDSDEQGNRADSGIVRDHEDRAWNTSHWYPTSFAKPHQPRHGSIYNPTSNSTAYSCSWT